MLIKTLLCINLCNIIIIFQFRCKMLNETNMFSSNCIQLNERILFKMYYFNLFFLLGKKGKEKNIFIIILLSISYNTNFQNK